MALRKVVTIDGPAGAGKSTVARLLAERLRWRLLDTGAMYRAVAHAALRKHIPLDDDNQLGELAERLEMVLLPKQFILDGQDVTLEIRDPHVSAASSRVAACPRVRRRLVACQRDFAAEFDTVTEGRDQGTVVFPDAFRKFFLVASAEARARRRHSELSAAGQALGFADVVCDLRERDSRDAARVSDPMRPAFAALIVDSTDVSIERIVDLITALVADEAALPWRVDPDGFRVGPLDCFDGWGLAWSADGSRIVAVAGSSELASRTAAEMAYTDPGRSPR